jgi:endonuclease/exonuclease/phosphatase family metal-dependent hydrolase
MATTMSKVGLALGLIVTAAIVGYFRNAGSKDASSGVSVPAGSEHSAEGPSQRVAMPDAATPPTKQQAQATAQPSAPATPAATPAAPVATEGVKVDPSTIRFGLTEPKPRTPGTIRVATFNIENLFDDKDDPKLTGSGDDKDMLKPKADRAAAALAIRRINADVLALQEVESLEALLWFRDEFLKDMGYEHVASIDAGDGRGIEQSVLSRFPLSNTKVYSGMKLGGRQPDRWGNEPNANAGKPFEFTRDPLSVTVTVPSSQVGELLSKAGTTKPRVEDYKITLLVVHSKSGRDFEDQREAEAKGLVNITQQIERDTPGANVLILGDFNATQNRVSLRTLADNGLQTVFENRDPRDPKTMTHTTGRCIDHIYFNANAKPEMVLSSTFVLGLPARPANADFRTTPAPAGYASDHYPVVVDVTPVEK